MNSKYFILSLCFLLKLSPIIGQNETIITVSDELTALPIAYVNISFGDKDGIYTDNNGQFNLRLIASDSMQLSALGYETKIVFVDSIKEQLIVLNPVTTQLEEVVLSDKKRKFKTEKTKPINDKDFLNSYRNPIGSEIACLIENNFSDNEVQIKSIIIPSYNKTMDFSGKKKQVLKRHPFATLYSISFYTNENGLPGKEITTESIVILFNEKTDKLNIDLEQHQIYLPKNGLYLALLNLGPADAEGNLIPTSPFYEKETKEGLYKFPKHIKPYFPVNYSKNTNSTYRRSRFDNDKTWTVFYLNEGKKDRINNITLGTEVKIYED
ncbi:carboxypeptidase-like regulatory domain-containing protein [Winogradskyella thalassocola]|uniref:CarboxypepD_reg-like domain-containing protein n=1 Tax=Winogradskyella thalassocola TaxID=262004 RepID=A0A1G8G0Z5_9FLAO|nr:carboxypeptidase-like regulatory domain-containing protein [Winogradskyella thalassocola]SDH88035.1 CarboxypepD_reg-like domain-containing protein [Winogradskyella thalassocola]